MAVHGIIGRVPVADLRRADAVEDALVRMAVHGIIGRVPIRDLRRADVVEDALVRVGVHNVVGRHTFCDVLLCRSAQCDSAAAGDGASAQSCACRDAGDTRGRSGGINPVRAVVFQHLSTCKPRQLHVVQPG